MELTINDIPITVDPIAAREIVRRHLLREQSDRDTEEWRKAFEAYKAAGEDWRKEFEAWKAEAGHTGTGTLACVAQNGTLPQLNEGEVLIGAYTSPDFKTIAAILLPGVKKNLNWKDANAWAKEQGGDLPNRIEALLLYTHHRALFGKDDVLWTNEQLAEGSSCAWGQSFNDGDQSTWLKGSKGMARAVRRVTI